MIHVQCPYIEMKKFFFFRTSSNDVNNIPSPPSKDKSSDNIDKSKSKKEVSSPSLRRSVSLSSGSFYDSGLGQRNFRDPSRSPCHSKRAHPKKSGRDPCRRGRTRTPERQPPENFSQACYTENGYFRTQYDPSESSSYCSSNVSSKVLDRYIDGEQEQEKSASANHYPTEDHVEIGYAGRQLPPRVHYTAPASPPDARKQRPISQSFREAKASKLCFTSGEMDEIGFEHASPRKLAKKVVERLSQSRSMAKISSEDFDADGPITIEDIYCGNLSRCPSVCSDGVSRKSSSANESNGRMYEEIPVLCERNYLGMEDDSDLVLLRKLKEAEDRAMLLSEELEEGNFLHGRGLSVPMLIQTIRSLTEEKVQMAFDVSSILRDQVAERASSKEEAGLLKAELDSWTRRLETEKNELQSALEKELDRRSSEWSLKLEKYQVGEHKLRERVREIAEQNVSLQREVSSLNEKEVDNRSKISFSEKQLEELTKRIEEVSKENQNLQQQLSQLQEEYRVAQDDRDYVRENYEEKVKECEDLNRSIARLQRTCNEQEKTIDGLRGFCEDVGKKSPANYDNQLEKLQVEQIRLVGVERALRKEVESYRLQTDSLRHENICLLNRLRGNGKEGGFSTFKLDQELCNRVCCLQNQGLNLLRDSSQLCGKLMEYTKANVRQSGGIDGQFLIECNVKIQGLNRGIETLTSSLQTVSSVINEKSNPVHSDSQPSEMKQLELKSETLLTTVLREKLYSKEMDIEQLQADLAAAVRGKDILKCEVQNALDTLSCAKHKMKDLELQMIMKDDNINQLQNELQECMKELSVVKGILPKVSQERDVMWEEVKNCSEKNMLLNSEINMLKKKVEALDEDILMKEGEITILKDSMSKPFDLLASHDSSREFLLE
ncbi:MAR-binding filament-like protein 1 isoform X1 [Nicotiana tomentosiformis]|uniref:MAR-binding filament-like protein 1 isoform X1 n=2 Tax=Nicotiana tomentosiformis TaxID=4098 RepID=UPI00051B8D20|nr:interaptin-like isoform X1 [Nicotiana tomentosiformis]